MLTSEESRKKIEEEEGKAGRGHDVIEPGDRLKWTRCIKLGTGGIVEQGIGDIVAPQACNTTSIAVSPKTQ